MLTRRQEPSRLLVLALLTLGVVVGVLAAAAPFAWAGGGGGTGGGGITVACGPHPSPGCVVGAHTPPRRGDVVSSTKAQPGDTDKGTPCRDWTGHVRPCVLSEWGWMGSDGCYYKLDSGFNPPAWDTADQPPAGEAGAYYDVNCAVYVNIHGTGGGIVWLPAGVAPESKPDPAVLARQARNELHLPGTRIVLSPTGQQLVNLPTWLAVARPGYTTQSASAAVPGESVTATATPTSVVWSTGDGTTVTCDGPGTVYTTSDDPSSSSPTCGHTYRVSSANQPGGVFVVTATVQWSVAWAGGGQRGTFPDLTTTATVRVPVAESQALTTG
jgi:hypothetical protein